MAQQAVATQSEQTGSPVVRTGMPNDGIKQMFDSIARRAFDIFKGNGQCFGHDVDDWLQAERELFHAAHIEVTEDGEGYTVRAEVPGFKAKELEINIEDRHLTISGKRETHEEQKDEKTVYSEYCSDQVLRIVDLPGDVKAELARADLKDGILEVELPKASPAKIIAVTAKTA